MDILVLQHIACEPPAEYGTVLTSRGHTLHTVEVDEGEPLPDWRDFGAIVAMGGPMGVYEDDAYPWLVGMSFRAIRTSRYKYIHWVNRARNGELDELYDLEKDPFELINVAKKPAYANVRNKMTKELRGLAADALGL